MKSVKHVLLGASGVIVILVVLLFAGGQTQRVDSFNPADSSPLRFTNVLVVINPPFPDMVAQNTSTLQWHRPEAIRPMVDIFVGDPSYDSAVIRGVTIMINRTNAVRLSDAELADPEYGLRLKFKPYDDPVAFRASNPAFAKADPRYAFYMPFPQNPSLAGASPVGTRVNVRVDFTIMAGERSVCATNVQAEFVLERQETRLSWASLLFLRLFMPRF